MTLGKRLNRLQTSRGTLVGTLVQTPEGFVLSVERAAQSLLGCETIYGISTHAKVAQSSLALCAPNRGSLLLGLLTTWTRGAVPLLLPDTRSLTRIDGATPQAAFEPKDSAPDVGELRFRFDDPVCQLFTSGSTGTPQTFEKCARQVFGEAFVLKELLELSARDVVLATTASHHLYGLLFGVFAPWAAGASIVASAQNEPGAYHPEKVAALSQSCGVTRLISVPAHLRALLQASVELPHLKTIVSSAAPLGSEDARRLEDKFGVPVLDVLGSTETGGLATRRASGKSIWTPLPGVRVQLDSEQQLLLSSPFLTDPAREERSGERARLHQDGTFEYLGRADSVVKVGGKRISLREIEILTESLDGVTDCACLSRPVQSLRGEEILLAVASTTLERKDVRAALRGQMDPTFLPRKIRVLQKLPRDERGKLLRTELLRLFQGLGQSDGPVEKSIQIPQDWQRFSGHFEGDPVLPALSQLADIILPALRETFGGGSLASLRRVKWTRAVRPGATLILRLENKPHGLHFQLFEGTALACSGTATLHSEGS